MIKSSLYRQLFLFALVGVRGAVNPTTGDQSKVNLNNALENGAQRCTSNQECAEDRACLINFCQDPCLNSCPRDTLCHVRQHVASCQKDGTWTTEKEKTAVKSKVSYSSKKTSKNGSWIPHSYTVMFPFSVQGELFFYGQCENSFNWFIQKLLPQGELGPETDHGEWNYFYTVQFPFTIGNRTFFYGHTHFVYSHDWFIQELLPGGKMGEETDRGFWNNFYIKCFPFVMVGRQFFFAYNNYSNNWFIQELLAGGKMGAETDHGQWGEAFNDRFPFSVSVV